MKQISDLDFDRLQRYETSVKTNERYYSMVNDLEKEQKRLWLVQDAFRGSLEREYKLNAQLQEDNNKLKRQLDYIQKNIGTSNPSWNNKVLAAAKEIK